MSPERLSMVQTVHLIGKAQQGDSGALEGLFRRYLPIARQAAALRLGKTTAQLVDVEDIVQEALMEAFRDLDRFDESQGKFCNWLSKIVENRIRMSARRRNAKKRGEGREVRFAEVGSGLHSSLIGGREATPSQHYAAFETGDRLQEALLAMDERKREVIIQRMICEMSYAEIAEQMELGAESSARSLYSVALKELRERVGD